MVDSELINGVFHTEWNKTQFATESHLQHEMSNVEEIHFTPGAPIYIREQLECRF